MKSVLLLITGAAIVFGIFLLNQQTVEHRPISDHLGLAALFADASIDPALRAAAMGVCVLDSTGRVVFEKNSRTAFTPASTLKTVTTGTALEILGPDFRFCTQVKSNVPIREGNLEGDLTLEGGGDPMLSLADLTQLATSLKSLGLRHVQGHIVGDGRLFHESIFDDFWNWGDIGNGFGSPVSGLNLEHNRYTASFKPGASLNEPAVFLGATPEIPGVNWKNEVLTGSAGSGDQVVIHGGERTITLHLRGTVPSDQTTFSVLGAVPDPVLFASHHFKRALVAAGIKIDGSAKAMRTDEEGAHVARNADIPLLEHRSPPLREIIKNIHAESDNHECECLFRILSKLQNAPSDQVIRDHWKKRGLFFDSLRMEDGCGLARADFIRPLDLALLQHLMLTGPQGEVYESTLLSHEEGRVRAKGGAMSSIHSYTGSAVSADGTKYTFAIMLNHHTDSRAAYRLRDRFIRALVNSTSVP